MPISKKKLREIYEDNKKVINIVLIFLFCVLILAIIVKIFDNNNSNPDSNSNSNPDSNNPEVVEEVKITLFGNKVMEIYVGEEYIEPGYYAITNLGEIKTEEVEVINQVNTNKPGNYTITYILGDKKATRTVKVLEKEEVVGNLTLTLKGNGTIILNQNEEYIEPGYEAIDSIDGNITANVQVEGYLDTSVAGTYTLTYIIENSRLEQKMLTRTIIVTESNLEIAIESTNQSYTNKDITLNILASGTNFRYVKYPDGTVSSSKNSTYKVSQNGTYTFYVYDSNLNYVVKSIIISNIDKTEPSGTCTLEYKDGKSTFKVVANDTGSGIKSYDYYGNNRLLINKTTNSYSTTSRFTSGYVIIFDKAGNKRQIDCSVLNSYDLEVHFINVGREDAILIRSSDKTIFIDGGTYNKKDTITPYLKDLGVTHIDAMIGSHLHYNHIQAQADILENFTVDKIYYPQDLNTCYSTYCDLDDQKYILNAIKKYNKTISIMKVGDNFNIGDMNIFCIGPISFQTKSQNKYRQNYNSLNFILTYGDTKFMFTGDYMQYSNILKRFSKNILDVDVLKYPHHGNASLGKELVEAMSPKYVVLTNSRDELSSRSEKTYLTNVGASFYYSYKHGNILMISDGEKITVKTNIKASDYRR